MATVGQISRVNSSSLPKPVSGQNHVAKPAVTSDYALKKAGLAGLTAAGNSLGMAAVLGGLDRTGGLQLCKKVGLLTIDACNDNRSEFVAQIEDMCLESVA